MNTVLKVKSRRAVWAQNGCISCWCSWLLGWLWAAVAVTQYLRRVSCITRSGKDKNSKFEVDSPLSGMALLPSSSRTNKSKHQKLGTIYIHVNGKKNYHSVLSKIILTCLKKIYTPRSFMTQKTEELQNLE